MTTCSRDQLAVIEFDFFVSGPSQDDIINEIQKKGIIKTKNNFILQFFMIFKVGGFIESGSLIVDGGAIVIEGSNLTLTVDSIIFPYPFRPIRLYPDIKYPSLYPKNSSLKGSNDNEFFSEN